MSRGKASGLRQDLADQTPVGSTEQYQQEQAGTRQRAGERSTSHVDLKMLWRGWVNHQWKRQKLRVSLFPSICSPLFNQLTKWGWKNKAHLSSWRLKQRLNRLNTTLYKTLFTPPPKCTTWLWAGRSSSPGIMTQALWQGQSGGACPAAAPGSCCCQQGADTEGQLGTAHTAPWDTGRDITTQAYLIKAREMPVAFSFVAAPGYSFAGSTEERKVLQCNSVAKQKVF